MIPNFFTITNSHAQNVRRRGFVLVYVIGIISLVGLAMVILTAIFRTVSYDTNITYLECCRRDLQASGMAWAMYNADNLKQQTAPEKAESADDEAAKASQGLVTVTLDVAKMEEPAESLGITASKLDDLHLKIHLDAHLAKGRLSRHGKSNYIIAAER